MKIIQVDNFDRDSVSDILIAESMTDYWANKIVSWLNKKFSNEDSSPLFFKAVSDDYKLYKYVS